jgi:hypothetical protein
VAHSAQVQVRSVVQTTLLFLVACFLGFPSRAHGQQAQHIITFDAPGAKANGTVPVGINFFGTVAGYDYDTNNVGHGFLRTASGKYITFDAPAAGTIPKGFYGTFPSGLNAFGAVAGYYNDNNYVAHGFLRYADGKFITFDPPASDINPADQLGTVVTGINDIGLISGFYYDSNAMTHGFLRSPDGKFTTFDGPGVGGYGTDAEASPNLEGEVVGFYTDPNYLFHAYVRLPNGKFQTFVGPDSCETGTPEGCYGSGLYNINALGTSVGGYEDNSANLVFHVMIRYADGKVVTVDAPGAGTGLYQGTGFNQVAGINTEGEIAENYLDSNNVYHGFIRTPDGKFVTFDAPGADLTPGDFNGTFPVSLNDWGVLTGYYTDSNNVPHGFLRFP